MRGGAVSERYEPRLKVRYREEILPRIPRMEREGLLEWAYTPRACNFFNELENDPEHVPFTHRDPNLPRGQYTLAERVDCIESNWGIAQHRHYPGHVLIVQHGMPNIRSNSRASSSARVLVTMVMSIPWVNVTLSGSTSGKMSCSPTPRV